MSPKDPDDGSLESIERELGLAPGILMGLLEGGDDWSFVIKAHALIESAANHLLLAALNEPRLANVLPYLELSDPRVGKLAIVGALDLLPKPHRQFIHGFSELRNRLVHDVAQVGFTFDDYLAHLDKNQRKAFKSTFGGIFAESKGPSTEKFSGWTEGQPRRLVWSSVLIVVALCYSRKVIARLDARLAELKDQEAELNAEMATTARSLWASIEKSVRDRGEFVIRKAPASPQKGSRVDA